MVGSLFAQDDNADSIDEIILKSGDVYKGTYISEDDNFIYFKPAGSFGVKGQGIAKYKIFSVTLYDGTIIFYNNNSSDDDKNNLFGNNSFRPTWSYSEPKDPFKSGMLSAIIPSGGHFYNEEYDKGVKYLVGVPMLYLIGSLITKNNIEKDDDVAVATGVSIQLVALFLHFRNAYDAIISSNNINKAYYDKYLENQQKEEAHN